MGTGASDTQADKDADKDGGASGPFDSITGIVHGHLAVIASFSQWLEDAIATRDHGGVAAKVKTRLDRYERWLVAAERDRHSVSDTHEVEAWAVEAQAVGPLSIVVTGPGLEDRVEITAKDEQEAEYILSVRAIRIFASLQFSYRIQCKHITDTKIG